MHLQYFTFERILCKHRRNGTISVTATSGCSLERINGSLLATISSGSTGAGSGTVKILGGNQYGRGENRGLHGRRQDLLHHPERRLIIGQRVHPDDNQIRNRIGNGHHKSYGDGLPLGNPCDPDGNTRCKLGLLGMVGRLFLQHNLDMHGYNEQEHQRGGHLHRKDNDVILHNLRIGGDGWLHFTFGQRERLIRVEQVFHNYTGFRIHHQRRHRRRSVGRNRELLYLFQCESESYDSRHIPLQQYERYHLHTHDNEDGYGNGNGHHKSFGNRIRIGNPCDPDGNAQLQFPVCRMVGRLLGNTDHLHRDNVEERQRNSDLHGTVLAVELM